MPKPPPVPVPPAAGLAPMIEHVSVPVNGATLHVARAGRGVPLVLLHGWPEFWLTWEPVMTRLAGRFQVVAPDLRGFGDSDKPAGPFGPEDQARDILAVLDALGLDRVGLVGHDIGGAVMQSLARMAPERLIGLFFFDFVYPGIGARMGAPDRLGETWYMTFHQTELAALEASLAVAADLQAERAALEQHWRQRLERAQYQADQARRRYASTEPENRLVARTLERDWETALSEQVQLTADYERFRRERPQSSTPAELAAIRHLTTDLPALWQAPATTSEDRQIIVRLLIERVLVTVVDGSEQVRLECHWHGGNQTTHELVRPVARVRTLSTYAALIARVTALHRAGHGCAAIAAILNQEAWRPAKRRATFNPPMVRRLLTTAGIVEPSPRRPRALPGRKPDEWTIRELAEELGVPQATLYNWVQSGRLRSRSVPAHGGLAKLVTADAATIAKLKTIRATPPPWRRLPPPVLRDQPTVRSCAAPSIAGDTQL